jgi:coenzyme F420-0:L-glutamate ligase / coenzyme F420-1:gamma-L-glutamate ligase
MSDKRSQARVELIGTRHIGLIEPGDDLPALILRAFEHDGLLLHDGDVLVIAQKVVSKAEGRYVWLDEIKASERALEMARQCQKDARLVELILRESREVLRCVPGVIVVENKYGVVLANAGIDRSNIEQTPRGERVLMLPNNPDETCRAIRVRLQELSGRKVSVVINDSIGRAWRKGTQGTAIGVSGLPAVQDMRGRGDLFGFRLQTTEVGTADEIAAAASLVMGQCDEGIPVVLVRGLPIWDIDGRAADVIRPRSQDLFR